MLLERRSAKDRFSFAVDDNRRAIEKKLVVAADLIHVNERNAISPCDLGEKLVSRFALAGVERRGRDVEENLSALARELVDRIVAIELGAEDFVVEPEVFADADGGALAGDLDDLRCASRFEVTQLIED